MLCELGIENLALFERATLAFGPGLNVITGETGAGKSLLIDALELLLGERPRASMVRKGASEARVEGRFVLAPAMWSAPELRAFFDAHLSVVHEEWALLPADEERELILARALNEAGRTRAWVNHRPVTQKLLRELAGLLVEIHGQNEHQRLLEPAEQTRLLDEFGQHEDLLRAYRERRDAWTGAQEAAASSERRAAERRDRLDLLRFQARELADVRDALLGRDELTDERERLRHAEDLARQLGAVASDLAGDDGGAVQTLRRGVRALEQWEVRLKELAPHAEELREALLHLEEASAGLERFLAGVQADPRRLEELEATLYALETLAKKHRTSLDGLAQRAGEIERELAALEGGEESQEQLATRAAAALAELEKSAAKLSAARKSVCARLAKSVQRSLAELGLEKARFEARVEPRRDAARFTVDGADQLEFFLAANPGEEPQPLRHVASGGEAARIMLALRTALAVRQTIPTLVFDEVDAGVGGRLGPKVGEHLRALGARHQILCVTHLPAIAALASLHFKVEKHVDKGRTSTRITTLAGDARVQEVADMIAGGAAHESARAEARRLLGQGA